MRIQARWVGPPAVAQRFAVRDDGGAWVVTGAALATGRRDLAGTFEAPPATVDPDHLLRVVDQVRATAPERRPPGPGVVTVSVDGADAAVDLLRPGTALDAAVGELVGAIDAAAFDHPRAAVRLSVTPKSFPPSTKLAPRLAFRLDALGGTPAPFRADPDSFAVHWYDGRGRELQWGELAAPRVAFVDGDARLLGGIHDHARVRPGSAGVLVTQLTAPPPGAELVAGSLRGAVTPAGGPFAGTAPGDDDERCWLLSAAVPYVVPGDGTGRT